MQDKNAILEALFLNKVENLPWDYFTIDFKELPTIPYQRNPVGEEMPLIFHNQIQRTEAGTFRFTPNSASKAQWAKGKLQVSILTELLSYLRRNQQAPRAVLKRIFDANSPSVENRSQADKGKMGKFNRKTHAKRQQIYQERIRNQRVQDASERVFILAEGDSWFNFPHIGGVVDVVRDIIDWLYKEEQFLIKSLAAGGDWLSNMIKTADYIQELDRQDTQVFLFSGGGNDLAGDRIAKMVRKASQRKKVPMPRRNQLLLEKRKAQIPKDLDIAKYELGLSYLSDEFFDFLNVTMSQYFLLLSELMGMEKYEDLIFITQGYDFLLPSIAKRKERDRGQKFMNRQMNTGKWLWDPLESKNVLGEEAKRAVLYTMIYEFNEMLIQLTQYAPFHNLYHIDCRGVTNGLDDWFDELHMKSHKYEEIANTYTKVIKQLLNDPGAGHPKVFRVKEGLQFSTISYS